MKVFEISEATSKNRVSVDDYNVLSLLDFCKGIAIVLVFLFHYNKTWFGWQGVHLFIVLSGFGLTYSCLKKNETILWKHWYIRRAERILPAYWLVSLFGFFFLVVLALREKNNVVINVLKSLLGLFLDLSLLRNLSYQTIFNYPNDQLWFVPLIFGLYVIFPYLYNLILKYKTTKGCLLILLGAMAAEFFYRTISVYFLDGSPVAFHVTLWKSLPELTPESINQIPNYFLFPFQLEAPFGIFPARIAEFVLGMIGAVLLVENNQSFNKIFSNLVIKLGLVIWIIGYALVYIGLWGWAFASFLIALGLTLWIINLALFFQQHSFYSFIKISQLGSWSYYIFLTHSVFIHITEFQVFANVESTLVNNNLPGFLLFKGFMFGAIVFGTAIASWLVMQFDRSKLPKVIISKTIAQLL